MALVASANSSPYWPSNHSIVMAASVASPSSINNTGSNNLRKRRIDAEDNNKNKKINGDNYAINGDTNTRSPSNNNRSDDDGGDTNSENDASSTISRTGSISNPTASSINRSRSSSTKIKDRLKHSQSEQRRRTRLRERFEFLAQILDAGEGGGNNNDGNTTTTAGGGGGAERRDRFSLLNTAIDRIITLQKKLRIQQHRSKQRHACNNLFCLGQSCYPIAAALSERLMNDDNAVCSFFNTQATIKFNCNDGKIMNENNSWKALSPTPKTKDGDMKNVYSFFAESDIKNAMTEKYKAVIVTVTNGEGTTADYRAVVIRSDVDHYTLSLLPTLFTFSDDNNNRIDDRSDLPPTMADTSPLFATAVPTGFFDPAAYTKYAPPRPTPASNSRYDYAAAAAAAAVAGGEMYYTTHPSYPLAHPPSCQCNICRSLGISRPYHNAAAAAGTAAALNGQAYYSIAGPTVAPRYRS